MPFVWLRFVGSARGVPLPPPPLLPAIAPPTYPTQFFYHLPVHPLPYHAACRRPRTAAACPTITHLLLVGSFFAFYYLLFAYTTFTTPLFVLCAPSLPFILPIWFTHTHMPFPHPPLRTTASCSSFFSIRQFFRYYTSAFSSTIDTYLLLRSVRSVRSRSLVLPPHYLRLIYCVLPPYLVPTICYCVALHSVYYWNLQRCWLLLTTPIPSTGYRLYPHYDTPFPHTTFPTLPRNLPIYLLLIWFIWSLPAPALIYHHRLALRWRKRLLYRTFALPFGGKRKRALGGGALLDSLRYWLYTDSLRYLAQLPHYVLPLRSILFVGAVFPRTMTPSTTTCLPPPAVHYSAGAGSFDCLPGRCSSGMPRLPPTTPRCLPCLLWFAFSGVPRLRFPANSPPRTPVSFGSFLLPLFEFVIYH